MYISVDCEWDTWGGSCSTTCGPGIQTRAIKQKASNGGKECQGIATSDCNLKPCPIECRWGPWGTCSTRCGPGIRIRAIIQKASNGGKECDGLATGDCNLIPCPPCPLEKSGYFEVFGKCYFTDTIKRSVDDSQAHCKEIFPLGGQLFEPRDEATNREVIKNRYKGSTWIGITDRSSRGSYRYESDNGPLTVSQWSSSEPNGDNERCVGFCSNSRPTWCDYPCNWAFLALCERTY